ncbi:MAG TPA: DUF4837 family protein [Brumimicrobium sp.]|nr:DUF4837 family protein [Brumimicrobium sp.]
MKNWLIFITTCLVLFSCLDEEAPKEKNTDEVNVEKISHQGGREIIDAGSKSQYTGKPGRLIVVAENTEYTDEIAYIFDSVFAAPMRPYYPPTPYFEIFQRSPQEFKKLSTRLRNVIDIKIDEKVKKGNPTMHIYENYYASTQLYTKLKAHDINDLYDLILEEVDYLFKIYDRQEWKRELYRHPPKKNDHVRSKLQSKFGIDVALPTNFRFESISDEYAIILFPDRTRQMDMKTTGNYSTSKVNFVQSGVMIWQYPYTDERQMHPDNLMMMRDTILKYYAKHEMKGVYMGTQDHPAVIPEYEKLRIGDVVGYQFRGLFKFTGEAEPSGGRFWSYHFKHPYRKTIVAISGYIDAPPTMSPSFDINRIRAIIYSLRVVE